MEGIKSRLPYEGIFFVKGINRGGGIALLWKEIGTTKLLGFSRNHIDVELQMPNLPCWRSLASTATMNAIVEGSLGSF